MSYFMIAVGAKPDLSSLPKVEALPIQESQQYLQRLTPMLFPDVPPSTVWFIHDGETGTSHNFILTSVDHMQMNEEPLSSTLLGKIVGACEQVGDSFRIWWADSQRDVERCTSIKTAVATITNQAKNGNAIAIEYRKSNGQPPPAPRTRSPERQGES